ncbi:MAG: LysR family transcriptional regulator [Advenella sp.]
MELRHLRYFDAIARLQHVTQAAALLRVAQPALTQQIRALESELGFALFQKSGRRIELTTAGKEFHDHAKKILHDVEIAVQTSSAVSRGEAGRIVVGYTESSSFSKAMAAHIMRARLALPGVTLNLIQDRTVNIINGISAQKIDVAFVRAPLPAGCSLQFRALAHEHLFAVVPFNHPLASIDAKAALSDFAQENFIAVTRYSGSSGLVNAIDLACQHAGFERKVVQYVSQFSSAINLVAAGLGVAIVPECMTSIHKDRVCYVALSDSSSSASVMGLVFNPNTINEAATNFVQLE